MNNIKLINKLNSIIYESINILLKTKLKDKTFNYLLNELILLTNSKLGIFGEVLKNNKKKVCCPLSISNISWNKSINNNLDKLCFNLEKLKLMSVSVETKESFYSNNIEKHNLYQGLPKNHPPIKTLFSHPVEFKDKVSFIILLANADQYSDNTVELFKNNKLLFEVLALIYYSNFKKEELKSNPNLILNMDLLSNKILDIHEDGIVIIDKFLKIFKYNEKLKNILNLSDENDIYSKNISSIIPYFHDIFIDDFVIFKKNTKIIDLEINNCKNQYQIKIENIKINNNDYYILFMKYIENKENYLLKFDTEVKTYYLNFLSHEIKNPLVNILNTANNIKKYNLNSDSESDVFFYSEIDKIIKSGNKISNILNDSFDFSNFNKNYILNKTKFNFSNVLDKILNNFKEALKIKNIKILVSISELNIFSDRYALSKIIKFILINCIRHLNTDDNLISIEFKKNNDFYELIIKDNGDGYSPKELDNFEKIEQKLNHQNFDSLSIYNSIESNLYLTKKLLSIIDSKINIKSLKDNGSEYKIIIPIEKMIHINYSIAFFTEDDILYNYYLNLIKKINLEYKFNISVERFTDFKNINPKIVLNKFKIIFIELLFPSNNGYDLLNILKKNNYSEYLIGINNNSNSNIESSVPTKYLNKFYKFFNHPIEKKTLYNLYIEINEKN